MSERKPKFKAGQVVCRVAYGTYWHVREVYKSKVGPNFIVSASEGVPRKGGGQSSCRMYQSAFRKLTKRERGQ